MEEEKIVGETGVLPPKITKDNIDPDAGTRKGTILSWVRSMVYTLLSSFLISIAVYSLITPNEFTIGGVSGLAVLANVASEGKIPLSAVSLGLNVPLIILAFFLVKRRFAIVSTINILTQSGWLVIMEEALPNFHITFPGGEASKMLAALAAGLLVGVSIALAFKAGGSTGGADIIAVMIQKKCKATSIAWMLFIINCIVIVSYVIVTNMTVFEIPKNDDGTLNYGVLFLPIIMSTFESYIESKTNETISNGFQSATEFRIITSKPDEMATALMRELSRGVTGIPAQGMYTKESRTMLLCVVNRRQVPTVRRIAKEVDPDSFVVMAKAAQVLGLGFYTSDIQ